VLFGCKDAQDRDKSKIEDFLAELLGFFGLLVFSVVIAEHLAKIACSRTKTR